MTTLTFAVRRHAPELVAPAVPTPRETKRLSDIDDQDGLRAHVPTVFFYRGARRRDDDPAAVIRRALGEALVPYYPLAGRLREVAGRKLVVDCTAEGVLFVEADADVRLAELEAATGVIREPLPCMDQLLFDVEGSSGMLNCPFLLIQVTRLLCGGFVFALRLNHVMCDATGIAQFIFAVAELARGLPSPTVSPAWSRELLEARSPPRPAFPHREYDAVPPTAAAPPPGDVISRTFTFTRADIAAIKEGLPPHLRDKVTTFEAVAAGVWRARTVALDLPADDELRLAVVANFRRVRELGLPAGYYGNACIFLMAVTTAGALRAGSLGDAVELVREAKVAVTAEYVRSTADHLVLRGRPNVAPANLLLVSDSRHAGFQRVDFGWGEPVYGGPVHTQPSTALLIAARNVDGEDELVVPIMLTQPAMDRFASEIEMLVTGGSGSILAS
ncbi:hypothetical protein PAHAL_3G113300 [Panicum hallii]|uniref:Uncharacterized protein n=1 Tax=Panicum hallii TaxID=206008 RepID=A0A2S3H7Z6_9POAL|nr:benzyl alcohol O-benzoyltransferase-like [Panicum hallii]PAN17206.1 hypothetical protein PAHAL_3G113300 [Panicum hallii]